MLRIARLYAHSCILSANPPKEHQSDDVVRVVAVHGFSTLADETGSTPCAIVETENGTVDMADVDRLQFITDEINPHDLSAVIHYYQVNNPPTFPMPASVEGNNELSSVGDASSTLPPAMLLFEFT